MPMTAKTKRQFEQEEQAYWKQRNELLRRYSGQWVAVVGGRVVAANDHINKTMSEAFHKTQSKVMFVTLVVDADLEFRIRQVSTGGFYTGYRRPMPMVTVPVSGIDEAARTDEFELTVCAKRDVVQFTWVSDYTA